MKKLKLILTILFFFSCAKEIQDDVFLSYNAINRFNQNVESEKLLGGIKNIISSEDEQQTEYEDQNQNIEHSKNNQKRAKKENIKQKTDTNHKNSNLNEFADLTLTINIKDANLDDVAQLISNITEKNIAVSPELKHQKINLNAKNIKGNDAIKQIGKSTKPKATTKHSHGITRLKPKKENGQKEDQTPNKKNAKSKPKLKTNNKNIFKNGIHQSIIKIKHSTADNEFKKKATEAWNNMTGGSKDSHILINSETKKIFLRGSKNSIKEFKNFIESIDEPIPKVKVEIILVLTDKESTLDLGINWSGIYNQHDSIKAKNKNFGFVGVGGRLNDFPTPTSSTDPNNSNLLVNPANLAINLFTKALSSLNGFASLPIVFGGKDLNLRRLDMILNASETDTKTKIIARPSALVTNNQVAKILVGQSIPIYTAVQDVSQGSIRTMSKLTYKEIGVSFQVQPTISSDKKNISLDMFIEASEISKGQAVYNAQGIAENPPQLLILKVKNNVVLENGQTTVIGGLINKKTAETTTRVPLLSKVPYVGALFRGKNNSLSESEDFIFITASVVE